MILWLSSTDAAALRRIPIELASIASELSKTRAALERVADSLERQPEARQPAGVVWHVASPKEE